MVSHFFTLCVISPSLSCRMPKNEAAGTNPSSIVLNREVFLKLLKFFVFSIALLGAGNFVAEAAPLKIGVVNLNQALNESEEGIRSKNLLESEGRQKQQELQLEQEELRAQAIALRDNLLLQPEAKKQKENELRAQEQALIQKSQQFEQSIRQKERQMSLEIFQELKAVIRTVAKKENYDLVLEKTAAEIILYMNHDTVDLTENVIDHYNSLKTSKQ